MGSVHVDSAQVIAVLTLCSLVAVFCIIVWVVLKSDQAQRDLDAENQVAPVQKSKRKRDSRGRFTK